MIPKKYWEIAGAAMPILYLILLPISLRVEKLPRDELYLIEELMRPPSQWPSARPVQSSGDKLLLYFVDTHSERPSRTIRIYGTEPRPKAADLRLTLTQCKTRRCTSETLRYSIEIDWKADKIRFSDVSQDAIHLVPAIHLDGRALQQRLSEKLPYIEDAGEAGS